MILDRVMESRLDPRGGADSDFGYSSGAMIGEYSNDMDSCLWRTGYHVRVEAFACCSSRWTKQDRPKALGFMHVLDVNWDTSI